MSRKGKAGRPATNSPPRTTAPRQASPSWLRRHPRAGRLLLAVSGPVLLLGLLEGTLRVFSIGYPTSLFIEVPESGTFGMNRQFGWRFFPRAVARKPVAQAFRIQKAEQTCRVFTLGASATLGIPDPAFSFSRSLEVMLRARYPEVEFEFVNTALTAINSHVVRPIADEAARHEADLLVVYLGNNEVVGPFSIGSSAGGKAGNLTLTRLGLAVRSTRLGQLLQGLAERSQAGSLEGEEWRGMSTYARHIVRSDDERLDRVRENFRRNLADICRAGTSRGVGVVLSTVAVNLRNSPPFASLGDSTLPAADLRRCAGLLAAAERLLAADQPAAARDTLLAARAIDASQANIHYLLGQADLALGNSSAAYADFSQALEYDGLRFRTDRRLNEVIRATAAELAADGVVLADTEQALRATEPARTGIPGRELFYEHVHLTFVGNYQVALALLPAVEKALPAWVRRQADPRRPVPTLADCAHELLFTPANEYHNLMQMKSTVTPYPFTAQLGHEGMLREFDAEMERLRAAATPELQRATLEAYQHAYQRRPRDLLLAANYARILAQTGNGAASQAVMRRLFATQPHAADMTAEEFRDLTGG